MTQRRNIRSVRVLPLLVWRLQNHSNLSTVLQYCTEYAVNRYSLPFFAQPNYRLVTADDSGKIPERTSKNSFKWGVNYAATSLSSFWDKNTSKLLYSDSAWNTHDNFLIDSLAWFGSNSNFDTSKDFDQMFISVNILSARNRHLDVHLQRITPNHFPSKDG